MTRWIVYGYGKYFTESIMWQLTGKLYPFSSDKKTIIVPIFSRLYHSLACFQQSLKTQSAQKVAQPASREDQFPHLSAVKVSAMSLWWHQLEHTSRGSFPFGGEFGRSLQGSDNYYLKHFSCIIWHPGCHVSWLLHLPRDTCDTGHGPLPWLQSPVTPDIRITVIWTLLVIIKQWV